MNEQNRIARASSHRWLLARFLFKRATFSNCGTYSFTIAYVTLTSHLCVGKAQQK